jgi:hypothetical protein
MRRRRGRPIGYEHGWSSSIRSMSIYNATLTDIPIKKRMYDSQSSKVKMESRHIGRTLCEMEPLRPHRQDICTS